MRPMSAMKICIVFFAVILLSSCATFRTVIREGDSELRIMIKNGQLIEEECTGDTGVIKKCFKGDTVDLKLVDTKGTVDESDDVIADVVDISDHAMIRIDPGTASGNCTYYFWKYRWWEVCD